MAETAHIGYQYILVYAGNVKLQHQQQALLIHLWASYHTLPSFAKISASTYYHIPSRQLPSPLPAHHPTPRPIEQHQSITHFENTKPKLLTFKPGDNPLGDQFIIYALHNFNTVVPSLSELWLRNNPINQIDATSLLRISGHEATQMHSNI